LLQALAAAAWQPAQALATQKLWAGLVQSLSAPQATHWPAVAPLAEHTGVAAARVRQAVAAAFWHPTQALATQKLWAGLTQSESIAHATHWPAAFPAVAQTVFPSVRPAHPVVPATPQPTHAPPTQKAFPGSAVHWLSAVQPTHLPVLVSQLGVGAAHAPASTTAWHPTHTPAWQKPVSGSVQSIFAAQVPGASGGRASPVDPSPDVAGGSPLSLTMGTSADPSLGLADPSLGLADPSPPVSATAPSAPPAYGAQPGAPGPLQTQRCWVTSQRRPALTPAWARH